MLVTLDYISVTSWINISNVRLYITIALVAFIGYIAVDLWINVSNIRLRYHNFIWMNANNNFEKWNYVLQFKQ